MRTVTVNISFKKNLLSEIDAVAKQESRSRSELLREAARFYIQKTNRWQQIFQMVAVRAQTARLTEQQLKRRRIKYPV